MPKNKETIKTCSILGSCYYKVVGKHIVCKYEGYCDYQLPKDSRVSITRHTGRNTGSNILVAHTKR